MVNRFNIVEKQGERIYPALPDTGVLNVTAKNGRDYSIRPIAPEIHGKDFPAWIMEPEGAEADLLTVYAYGLGENAAAVENEAHELAALGYNVAVHETPRTVPFPRDLRKLRTFVEDMKNPLILPSMAISGTMDAAQAYSDKYERFAVKARSMGGLTGIMLACHEEGIVSLHLDGSAGVVLGNAIINHSKHAGGIIKQEIAPATKYLRSQGPADMMGRMLGHVGKDPTRLPREIGFLLLKRPDIARGLEEIHDRGVITVLVSHENDQFFEEAGMERAARMLVSRGLLTYYHQSKGTKHVNGLIAPQHNAELYRDTLRMAAEKQARKRTKVSAQTSFALAQ